MDNFEKSVLEPGQVITNITEPFFVIHRPFALPSPARYNYNKTFHYFKLNEFNNKYILMHSNLLSYSGNELVEWMVSGILGFPYPPTAPKAPIQENPEGEGEEEEEEEEEQDVAQEAPKELDNWEEELFGHFG
jgi:hypothetical protein